MIDIAHLNKKYGSQHVLDNIDLQIGDGECVALIGPNGSGKTTLIKCVLSLVIPNSGDMLIHGLDTKAGSEYRRHIGYMPQISRLPEHMRVDQLFNMMKTARSSDEQQDLDEELYFAFGIQDMEKKNLGELSGGMRQKVSATLAFLFNPSILILDEPTAALDPVANEILKEKILKTSKEGRSVLITSHNLSDLDGLIHRVIYLMEGKILFDHKLDILREITQEKTLGRMVVNMIQKQEVVYENQ
jgi:Cu-processing system ATP-binding protein